MYLKIIFDKQNAFIFHVLTVESAALCRSHAKQSEQTRREERLVLRAVMTPTQTEEDMQNVTKWWNQWIMYEGFKHRYLCVSLSVLQVCVCGEHIDAHAFYSQLRGDGGVS